MKYLGLLLTFILIMIVFLGASCNKKQPEPQESTTKTTSDTLKTIEPLSIPVTAKPNKSKATVYILAITQKEYPNAELTLKVDSKVEIVDEETTFLKGDEEIKVSPEFVRESTGQVILDKDNNRKLASLYDYAIGDSLIAILSYRGDEHGGRWFILDFEKIVKTLKPNNLSLPNRVTIAPNRSSIIAMIIEKTKREFPEVEIVLDLVKVEAIENDKSEKSFIKKDEQITATPFYYRDATSTVITDAKSNKELLKLYDIKIGTLIKAEVTLRGDAKSKKWFIINYEIVE